MTAYLAKQNVAGIKIGYNNSPRVTDASALPGMKGPDLQSWRDIMRPVFDAPYPSGYGQITQPAINAIAALQFIPNVYAVQRRR